MKNKEKYLKGIILVPILSMIFLSGTVLYISNRLIENHFKNCIQQFKNIYIKNQKDILKNRVDSLIDYIRYINENNLFADKNQVKQLAIDFIKIDKDLKRYFFIFDAYEFKTKNSSIKVILHSNIKELEGKILKDSYTDAKKKEFLKKILKISKKQGEGFVSYHFKKTGSDKTVEKLTYFKLYKEWNWIIGSEIYMDDINNLVNLQTKNTSQKIKNLSFNIALAYMLALLIIATVLYFLMRKIKNIIIYKNQKILKHKKYLETIVDIQSTLMKNSDFDKNIIYSFKKISKLLDIDRVYIFQHKIINSDLYVSKIYEYSSSISKPQIDNPQLHNIAYKESEMQRWLKNFEKNKIISGIVRNFPQSERDILEPQNIKSVLCMPIFIEDRLWGFVGFDDCTDERIWNDLEINVLKTLSNSFVNAYLESEYTQKLNQNIEKQVTKLRAKDKLIMQQVKIKSIGNTLKDIAHQWRQPLNILSLGVIKLQYKSQLETITKDDIEEYAKNSNTTIQNLSKTIDLFSNFFRPNIAKEKFNIKEAVKYALSIVQTSNQEDNINTIINNKSNSIYYGYKNEFSQIILDILNNSRDAIFLNKIENPKIEVIIEENKDYIQISIQDNAGGIKDDLIDMIFDPYFTTKDKSDGTGLSMYMAKITIEEKMHGDITIQNRDAGTVVVIKLFKYGEN